MYLHPLLADLPSEEKAALVQRSRLRSLKKGEVLLAAGAAAEHLYIVATGAVRVDTAGSDSRTSTTGFLGPHETHAESITGAHPVSCSTLVAALNSSVYLVPLDALRSTAMRFPAFTLRLLELMLERQQKLRRQLRRISTASPETVVGRTLYELSEVAGAGPNTVDKRITQSTIAAYSGLSRERVNRTMKDLENRGLIKRGNEGIRVDTGFSSTGIGSFNTMPAKLDGNDEHDSGVELIRLDLNSERNGQA